MIPDPSQYVSEEDIQSLAKKLGATLFHGRVLPGLRVPYPASRNFFFLARGLEGGGGAILPTPTRTEARLEMEDWLLRLSDDPCFFHAEHVPTRCDYCEVAHWSPISLSEDPPKVLDATEGPRRERVKLEYFSTVQGDRLKAGVSEDGRIFVTLLKGELPPLFVISASSAASKPLRPGTYIVFDWKYVIALRGRSFPNYQRDTACRRVLIHKGGPPPILCQFEYLVPVYRVGDEKKF